MTDASKLRDKALKGDRVRLQYAIASAATLAATALFVAVGSARLSAFAREATTGAAGQVMSVVLILNIALILLAWRRSKDLRTALEAQAAAERSAHASRQSDHVTGLCNRIALTERISAMLASHRDGVLLLLDLDNFKRVNDLYGHAAGDRLLSIVAQNLVASVPPQALCARIGGDEFAILLSDRLALDYVNLVADRILRSLATPIILEETEAHISASIGIAVVDETCDSSDTLLRRSDIAMYEAKKAGRNRSAWFDRNMEQELHRKHLLEAEIRQGIARGEFVPFYQPLINLATGELNGFEALARWNHPDRGLLEPADFLPIAESSALISTLSLTVMRQALLAAKKWPDHLHIAINVSPTQFKDPALAQRIVQILTEVGFPPQRLEIEITENSLLEDQDLALATLSSLKNLGVTISLDDFGTGYASLASLTTLPFDRIKIDRSLVSPVLADRQSDAIVSTIANFGQSLDLPVTAEGVESDAVRQRLQSMGCTDAQGWLFGRAVSAEDVDAMFVAPGAAAAMSESPEAPPAGKRRRRRA